MMHSVEKIAATPVLDLELSTRTKRGLVAVGVVTVGEFAYMTEKDFLRIGNLGRKSLNEMKDVLSSFGIRMGMLASEGRKFPWHDNLEPEMGWATWNLLQSMPKERGRPRLSPGQKRQQIGVRTSPSLKTALEAAAAANCRSVAQEAEWRLERSFADADLRLRVNQIEQRLEGISPMRPYGD
ncbi:MAG: hypothetical protein EON58_21230 [Alphaproteobacteria bacterium]|nr:MAG: hypothetical protein EON58_21230 [Alphaproteobacteria bacterium]